MNRSPDTRRAAELKRLREQLPPPVPEIAVAKRAGMRAGEEDAGPAPKRPRVVSRRLAELTRMEREERKLQRILLSGEHYPPEDDQDLSLYEDLGVTRTATPEEIRKAHKALARLLHPDRIRDEFTRKLAEATLKKINAAFAVLNDPEHRANYDRECGRMVVAARTAPLPGVWAWFAKRANPAWARQNFLWIGGTVVGLLVIYWVLGSSSPQPRTVAAALPERASAQRPAAAAGRVETARAARAETPARETSEGQTAGREPAERETAGRETAARETAARETVARAEPARGKNPAQNDAGAKKSTAATTSVAKVERPEKKPAEKAPLVRAKLELPKLAAAQKPALIAPPEIQRPGEELLPAPPDFSARASASVPPPPKATVDGLWVYLKPARTPENKNSYPPEFIELTLREIGGVVQGRYAARYRVADLPISPEVHFQFDGAPMADKQATYTWAGNGGSRGEVRLSRISDHQMQVIWFTTAPGPQMGLSSGSATLVRRQTP